MSAVLTGDYPGEIEFLRRLGRLWLVLSGFGVTCVEVILEVVFFLV